MKITHNPNNRWQEEARTLDLDEDLYPWIEAIIKDERLKEASLHNKGDCKFCSY